LDWRREGSVDQITATSHDTGRAGAGEAGATRADRLLERALEVEGTAPIVIDTPDAAEGTPPLPHSGCTVVKANGDYLDTRTKNAPEEFGEYDGINALLGCIFGLEKSAFIPAPDCRLDSCPRGAHHAPQVELRLIETLQLRLKRFRDQPVLWRRQEFYNFRVVADRIGDYDVLTRR